MKAHSTSVSWQWWIKSVRSSQNSSLPLPFLFRQPDLWKFVKRRSLGQAPCTGSRSLYKHWDSFYSLDSRQVTRQTTWSQKQQGYARIEASSKQRQNCLCGYRLAGFNYYEWRSTKASALHFRQQKSCCFSSPGLDSCPYKQHSSWLCRKCSCCIALQSTGRLLTFQTCLLLRG